MRIEPPFRARAGGLSDGCGARGLAVVYRPGGSGLLLGFCLGDGHIYRRPRLAGLRVTIAARHGPGCQAPRGPALGRAGDGAARQPGAREQRRPWRP